MQSPRKVYSCRVATIPPIKSMRETKAPGGDFSAISSYKAARGDHTNTRLKMGLRSEFPLFAGQLLSGRCEEVRGGERTISTPYFKELSHPMGESTNNPASGDVSF